MKLATALALAALSGAAVHAAEPAPVATIFGRPVFPAELDAGRPANGAADAVARWRAERLRALVWSAVFEDYARERAIEPTAGEIESNIHATARRQQDLRAEHEQQRRTLAAEIDAAGTAAPRRAELRRQLETLERLLAFDARRDEELRDPERRRLRSEAERRVAAQWVRSWKVNQALYREFGGRIAFQQAGWEPIDAYRKLLDRYAANRSFVVDDPQLRAAVYAYFEHRFVYADETRARFYFERPWWERSPQELRAAGF